MQALRHFTLLMVLFTWSQCLAQQQLVVGAQSIDYFPHYNFNAKSDKGYAWALLNAFAEQKGYKLIFVGLPIKRLQVELKKGSVDLAYPDNPKWTSQSATEKHFSVPLTHAMGGTIVNKSILGKGVNGIQVLSVPFGFSPVMWYDLIEQRKIRIVTTPDARSALQLVLMGRAQAADVEYHVARYQLRHSRYFADLALDPTLPYDIVGFSLSTYRYANVIDELNIFLSQNQDLMVELSQRYGLRPSEQVLKEARSALSGGH